jgi:hypothetical protein
VRSQFFCLSKPWQFHNCPWPSGLLFHRWPIHRVTLVKDVFRLDDFAPTFRTCPNAAEITVYLERRVGIEQIDVSTAHLGMLLVLTGEAKQRPDHFVGMVPIQ